MASKRSEKDSTAQTAMAAKRRLHESAIKRRRESSASADDKTQLQETADPQPSHDEVDADDDNDQRLSTPPPKASSATYRDNKFFMGHHKGNFHVEKGCD